MQPTELRDALLDHGFSIISVHGRDRIAAVMGVERRTLERWLAGRHPVPAWVPLRLKDMRKRERVYTA